MTSATLRRQRLLRQQLLAPQFSTPGALVRHFGAVQAQDYRGALWALGQRLPHAVEADVEAAIASRTIVRTWPMRGTLHFVAATDVYWMLPLLTPRVLARSAGRYSELGLDEAAFKRSRTILLRRLRDGRRLTRPEAYAALERGGVSPQGQRGIHILAHLAQQGLLCLGPWQGRQPTFLLLEEWIPPRKALARDAALAALATRYFASHGPATVHDFAWWSGLPVKEAQQAIASAAPRLLRDGSGCWSSPEARELGRQAPAQAALLPPWDEFLVSYKERSAALEGLRPSMQGVGSPLILVDGRVKGAWRRTLTPTSVHLKLDLWTKLTPTERRALEKAVEGYGRFLGRDLRVSYLDT